VSWLASLSGLAAVWEGWGLWVCVVWFQVLGLFVFVRMNDFFFFLINVFFFYFSFIFLFFYFIL